MKLDILPRNSGMNVAVERCMQLSSGKYVANLSSDDLWEPAKLAQQVAFLERHPEYDAVFTQVKVVGEDGEALKANRFYESV
ncbi:MAG: glycosyltransferase family A protein [Eubacteriales bacterium]